MMRVAALIPVSLALMACEPTGAPTPRMSVEQAEVHCTARAKQFANTTRLIPDENGTIQVGLQAELPDSFMITDFYKRCFYANAGQRPTSIPKIPAFG